MASASSYAVHVHSSAGKRLSTGFHHLKNPFSSSVKHVLKELMQLPLSLRVNVATSMKNTSRRMLDAFVDSVFRFEDHPSPPSRSNFVPVEEIGEAVNISCIEGEIPIDFPVGAYIRNGSNPLFGGLKSVVSVFGRSSNTWIEGEGMLHAIYFSKDSQGNWSLSYKNKYVETETFKMEKERNMPSFLPAVDGDSSAVLVSYLLNQLRFGKVNKELSNTNVFEHSGKFYAIAENYIPQEIDILSLKTLGNWDVNGAWDRPFASHPKRAPGTGELVNVGVDAIKPYLVLGVISADGKKLHHKVDLKFKRCCLSHEIGVTEKYNLLLDFPLTVNLGRLIRGEALIKYEKEEHARIGVMPRYGDADSIKWFDIEPHCTFHIFNCFDDGNEVVVRVCRAPGSVIPGPDLGVNNFELFSRGSMPIDDCFCPDGLFFSRAYEWRLNMETGEATGRYLTGTNFSMDFPMINNNLVGLRNKYGYTQVVDSPASSNCSLAKYGMLGKLHFDKKDYKTSEREKGSEEMIKVEYHKLEKNQFCSGATFVAKPGGGEEDGWLVTYVHNEDTDISEVHIIDTRNFAGEPVAKIMLPQRVPYGFHGTFIST